MGIATLDVLLVKLSSCFSVFFTPTWHNLSILPHLTWTLALCAGKHPFRFELMVFSASWNGGSNFAAAVPSMLESSLSMDHFHRRAEHTNPFYRSQCFGIVGKDHL